MENLHTLKVKTWIIQNVITNRFIQLVINFLMEMLYIFYFNDDSKLYIYYIEKIRCYAIKNNSSFLFIECTEINWKTSNLNGL